MFIHSFNQMVGKLTPTKGLACQCLLLSDVKDKAVHVNKWGWSISSHWS